MPGDAGAGRVPRIPVTEYPILRPALAHGACYRLATRPRRFPFSNTHSSSPSSRRSKPSPSLASSAGRCFSRASEIARCNRVRVGYSRFGNRCNLRTLIKLTSGMRNGRMRVGRERERKREGESDGGAGRQQAIGRTRGTAGWVGFRGRHRVTGGPVAN